MITIFTTAKSFLGEARKRQLNALRSWKELHTDIEIILFGSGEGYKEVAADLSLLHIPDVQVSERGTPLINSMFEIASTYGKYPFQAYVNCDIILMDDFVTSLKMIDDKLEKFMIVGQRWDIDINEEIDFKDRQWQSNLRSRLSPDNLHPPTGSDYFLYRRGIWNDLPPMVVGRAGYDNWLIYYCRLNGVDVIDASEMITLVHQNHDYSHLTGGAKEVWKGREAQSNFELAGGRDSIFTLLDSNWLLTSEGLMKNRGRGHFSRFIEANLILNKNSLWGKIGLHCFRTAGYLKSKITCI